MTKGGWCKFHKRILDWRWYTDGNTFRLFFHLIMTASHKDKPWKNIVIKRGQRIASYDSLAEELQLTRKQIRTALNHLKETNEVAHEGAKQYSIITIINYDKYQALLSEEDPQDEEEGANEGANERAGQGHTKGTRRAPSEEYKEDEEVEEGIKNTTPTPSNPDPVPYSEIAALYNEQCHGLPKVKALTEMRRRSIRARWNANRDNPLGHFRELFEKAGKSDFLSGINDRAWIADFDWLMKEQNAVKVLEGKYDNSARAPAGLKPQGRDKPETNAQKNARIAKELMQKFNAEEGKNGN